LGIYKNNLTMKSTQQIVQNANKDREKTLISKISNLPIIEKHFSTINDNAYNEPIVEITPTQNTNLKNLLNEN